MRKIIALLPIGLMAYAASANAAATPTADGVTGQVRQPLVEAKQAKKRAVALFFVTTDCPIANRFAPEINKICRDYEKRGVAFFVVQTDKTLKASQAMEHAKQFGFSCPVLPDRRREIVKFCGATVTPEAALLSTEGKVLYRGRIDDRYAALKQPRAMPTRHDLRLALDSTLAGKPVEAPRTKAIGCYIED